MRIVIPARPEAFFGNLDNLPEPEVLADEIIENIEAGLASFREVAAGLAKR